MNYSLMEVLGILNKNFLFITIVGLSPVLLQFLFLGFGRIKLPKWAAVLSIALVMCGRIWMVSSGLENVTELTVTLSLGLFEMLVFASLEPIGKAILWLGSLVELKIEEPKPNKCHEKI